MDNRISNNVSFKSLHLAPANILKKSLGKKNYAKFEAVIPELRKLAEGCDVYIKPEIYMFERMPWLDVKVRRPLNSAKDFFMNLGRTLNIYNTVGERVFYPEKCEKGFGEELVDMVVDLKAQALK
jgi:hypothetical protein